MHDFTPAFEPALSHAMKSVDWAGVRYSREAVAHRGVRNDNPESNRSSLEEGAMCEVLLDGHFGYAATADLGPDGLRRAFDRAIATTRSTSPHKLHAFTAAQRLAERGVHRSARSTPLAATRLVDITDCLLAACSAMRKSVSIVDRSAAAVLVQTDTAYLSSPSGS